MLAPAAPADLRVDDIVEGTTYPAFARDEGVLVENLFGPYDARLMRRSFVALGQRVALRVGSPPSLYANWISFLLRHPAAWSSLTTCPAPVLLEEGSWKYHFDATVGERAKASVRLSGDGDPGYNLTAVALGELAVCLATDGCGGAAAGVLTPALAVNRTAFLGRLETIGAITVERPDANGRPSSPTEPLRKDSRPSSPTEPLREEGRSPPEPLRRNARLAGLGRLLASLGGARARSLASWVEV